MKNRGFNNQSIKEDEYNNFDEIDVNKTAEKLVKCANDRMQFESYIKKINNLVLGEETNKSLFKKSEEIEQISNMNKSFKAIKLGVNLNGSQINSRTSPIKLKNEKSFQQKSPKKFLMEENNINDNSSFNKETNSMKFPNRTSYKNNPIRVGSRNLRSNDVNANSKYYYPVDMNSADESDISNEPAQWNDRSNRNTILETNKSTNYDKSRERKITNSMNSNNF